MTVPRYSWQPSTAEVAARAGIAPAEVIRADQNSSPFTPPWLGSVAAASSASVNEYPAAQYRELRRAIGGWVGADEDMIVPGAGADELILLAARAFLPPGGTAVAESPTYSMYRIATLQQSAVYREVPRVLPSAEFPTEALSAAARDAEVTWLCVPHNPIGDRPATADIDAVVSSAAGITVIDAAYAEFAGDRWGEYAAASPGVVVLGTLSKAFALAGARVGYAVARPDLADAIDRLRPPGSVASISVALALRALSETGWMLEHVELVTHLRASLAAGLAGLGLTPRPSETNFVLVSLGAEATAVAERLMRRGIVVRTFPAEHPLADQIRFTVRRADQQDRMLEALGLEMR